MSPLTILILVLIGVILAIVIGTKFNINMGLLALIFACIIGGYVLGGRPRLLYTAWPSGVVLQIIGVTFFYGFVNETGAIKALTDRIVYRVKNAFWLMPFVIFILAAGLGYVGVNPMGINALLLPIIGGICMYTNRSPFALFLIYGAGQSAGLLSPLGSAGIVASGMLSGVLGEDAVAILPRMYLNNLMLSVILFIIWFIVFRCWGMKVDDAHKEQFLNTKPAPMTKPQKQVIWIMFITIAVFVVFGVFRVTVVSSVLDVAWVYALAGCVCIMLKIAEPRKVINTQIPWGIILLVGGFTILLSILTNNGGTEMLSGLISNNVGAKTVPPLMSALAGLTSLFSDSIGVVMPLYIPIAAGTLGAGVSATAVFSAAIIGGLSTGCAPFSTGGAMVMSFAPDVLKKKMFWVMLLSAAVNLVVVVLLAFIGLFG